MSILSRWLGSIREDCTTDYKVLIFGDNGFAKNVCTAKEEGDMDYFVPKNVFFSKDRSEKCVTFQKFVPNSVDAVISEM
jgi:hypothetical protein